MQHKMMEGFQEAYRVLKPGGHAVYNISAVDDHGSDNTKKWIQLLYSAEGNEDKMVSLKLNDIRKWLDKCVNAGFRKNKDRKIYAEMPAPDSDIFPFENMILRWMARYVMVSEK